MTELRFKLPPGGDVPPLTAARRMGMSLEAFTTKLPELIRDGFPPPHPITGNYCLEAIDAYRLRPYPHLSERPSLTPQSGARNAEDVVRGRLRTIRGG